MNGLIFIQLGFTLVLLTTNFAHSSLYIPRHIHSLLSSHTKHHRHSSLTFESSSPPSREHRPAIDHTPHGHTTHDHTTIHYHNHVLLLPGL
jgi:hypothetical protein